MIVKVDGQVVEVMVLAIYAEDSRLIGSEVEVFDPRQIRDILDQTGLDYEVEIEA